jgi:hypothetical protein
MALIASARERPFESHELFVWTADGAGIVRDASPVFVRLCGADPRGHAYATLAAPAPGFDRPRATYTKHRAADGGVFWAMVFTLPVGAEVLGVGVKARAGAAFADAVAARRERRVDGDAATVALRDLLGGLDARLARHGAPAETFARRSEVVEELAEEIRRFSLNAILAAHRVSDAAAIGAVADLMQRRSDAAGPEILALRAAIERTGALLARTRFRAAAGELLAEALLVEPGETVSAALADTVEAACASVEALEAALDRLAAAASSVDRHLKLLRFLELQGRIEAARAHDTEHVRTLFEEIGVRLRTAGAELRDLIALGRRRDRDDGATVRDARRYLAALRDA